MEKEQAKQVSNREIKSSAFTTYFSDPKNAAQLYSALDGVEVAPEDISFTTLEGVLFVARKNDLAFTVQNKVLVISEHQATVNVNMPLRGVIYYGRTMEKLIDSKALYRRKQISLPTPEFYVFYNGDEPCQPEQILKLSDAYLEKTDFPMLELIVKVININLPVNHAILEQCRPLYEYSWFIQRIKEYLREGMERDTAIIAAIKDCERDGILTDFVKKHGSEAVNMLFTEFNMEDALGVRYEEGFEDGAKKGRAEGRSEGEKYKLIELVCRKLQKGKNAITISEELEEDIVFVEQICAVAHKSGEYDAEKVFLLMQSVK